MKISTITEEVADKAHSREKHDYLRQLNEDWWIGVS